MPRNSGGTYSLPAGNPVVTGTVISSTWANTTLEDLADAMTDSLSRSGDGGMLAALEIVAGTVGVPGLSFTTDTDSGFYLIGANNIGLSLSGTLRINYSTSSVISTVPYLLADGAVGAPSYSFANDTDTGAYLNGTGEFAIATAGTRRVGIDSTGLKVVSGVVSTTDGSAGTPSFAFSSDTDTGAYLNGAGEFAITTAGTRRIGIDLTGLTIASGILKTLDGSASAPTHTFGNDTDCGMYLPAANQLGLAAGGREYIVIDDNGGSINTISIGPSAGAGTSFILVNHVVTTSVGLAGAASALPATPEGYLSIQINGNNRRIPYYLA